MGDDKDNEKGVGFSGISSLLPDDPPDTAAHQSAPDSGDGGSRSVSSKHSASTSASPPSPASPSALQSQQPAPRPRSGGGAIWAWVGGIAVVVFLIWAASQSGTRPARQSAYQAPAAQTDSSTQPSTTHQADQAGAAAITSPPDETDPFAGLYRNQANNAVATASTLNKLAVQRPPIGSGNVFSVAEIRYCLALKQRVEGAKPVVDTYNHGQVERFNAMVDDYNGRCHNFLYHTGDLEQARRDMAPFSDQLQAQGRQVVQGGTTSQPSGTKPNADTASRQTILYVQRTLNALGYKAGVPDGTMGSMTRTAIRRFQRDKYLPSDGLVNDSLIDHLRAAQILLVHSQWGLPSSSGNSPKAPTKTTIVSTKGGAPAIRLVHAHMIGSCSPEYPVDAARSAQTGTTILAVRVGMDGGVTAVDVVSSSGSAPLDHAAVAAMEQCRFTPANRDGAPAIDELRIPVSFNFARETVGSHTW